MEQIAISLGSTVIWGLVVFGLGRYAVKHLFTHLGTAIAEKLSQLAEVGKEGAKFSSHGKQSALPVAPESELISALKRPALQLRRPSIEELLQKEGITADHREDALLTIASAAIIGSEFERAYHGIFASQFAVLEHLLVRRVPVELATVKPFYELGVSDAPSFYADYPFDAWLGWLTRFGLIFVKEQSVAITQLGEEFLAYVARMDYARPSHA